MRKFAEIAVWRVALGTVGIAQFADLDVQGYTPNDVLHHRVAARLALAQGNNGEHDYHRRMQQSITSQLVGNK